MGFRIQQGGGHTPKALYRAVVGIVGSWLGISGTLLARLLDKEVMPFTAASALCWPFWSHEVCNKTPLSQLTEIYWPLSSTL